MYDLIIIGAGPAGLTAALYAARSRLKTLLLEKMAVGGRILMSELIENYPGFPEGISTQELMKRMEDQIRAFDVEVQLEAVQEINCVTKTILTNAGSRYQAKAIIIATGAVPRKLNIPGEERLTGRGVSYCATCDASFFKGKNVCVAGGGNAVAEEALYLTRFAKTVTVIHRRDLLRASPILQERLKENPQIQFCLSSIVAEINGAVKVESVTVKDVATGLKKIIACDGIFVYIGYDPDTGFLKDTLQLEEAGFIVSDEAMVTSCEGIFACGDCRKKSLYQVITACADGAVAADSAYKYIASKEK